MPFTFAHPALILPISKIRSIYISASCLVIGSLTPDFEYFLTMKATGRYSHSVAGAFALDMPIAFTLVVIFHSMIKDPFINNLPTYFYQRLLPLRDFEFIPNFRKNAIGYLLCLLAGIFSHIIWDSFTHTNSYFVDRISVLSNPVHWDGLPSWPLYRYLQHLSTLAGTIVIVFFIHMQPIQRVKKPPIQMGFWIGIAAVTGIAFIVRWAFGFEYFADIVASLISSLLLATIVISFIFTIRKNPSK